MSLLVIGLIGGTILMQLGPTRSALESLSLDFVVEGWFAAATVLGVIILLTSRFWAIPPGVEWGWMSIRLAAAVLLVAFACFSAGLLTRDREVRFSSITGSVLLIGAAPFLRTGLRTIKEVISASVGNNVIFISYRRADSQEWADRITEHLKARFGANAVFQDVEDIPLGLDFPTWLENQLRACKICLVLIGPDWVSVTDKDESRRLDKYDDWVRIEIEKVLNRNIPVVPLLVKGASMPAKEDLPPTIMSIATRVGTPIRPNPDFKFDMDKLVHEMEKHLDE